MKKKQWYLFNLSFLIKWLRHKFGAMYDITWNLKQTTSLTGLPKLTYNE